MDETQRLPVVCRSSRVPTLTGHLPSATRGVADGEWRRCALRQLAAGVAVLAEASVFIPGSISDARSALGFPD